MSPKHTSELGSKRKGTVTQIHEEVITQKWLSEIQQKDSDVAQLQQEVRELRAMKRKLAVLLKRGVPVEQGPLRVFNINHQIVIK